MPVALAVPENPVAPVVLENPAVPAELIVQVEAVPVQNHRPALLAVPPRTKSVTAPHRPDLVPLLEAGEDLAAAVAETTREPAAAEAVIAWEVAATAAAAAVVVVTEPAAVAADAAVAAEDAAVAAEDAEDKRTSMRRRQMKTKTNIMTSSKISLVASAILTSCLLGDCSARCAIGQNGCACDSAAKPKRIRHTEAGR